MGFAHRAFVAAGVGFAMSAIAGCGSSGRWLSQSESNSLSSQLNSVTQALADQNCHAAQSALTRFENAVAQLNGIDSTLLANLNQGASTVQDLANARCASELQTSTTHTKTSTTPTTTATQTATTQTYTTPTDTTATDTTPGYSTPSTDTTGGSTPTSTAPSTSTTSPASGGQGLGSGSTTATTGNYGNPNPNSNGVGNAYGYSGGGN